MAAAPRNVRRDSTPPDMTFDDHLWPVNVALVFLASFLAGVIVTKCTFDFPALSQDFRRLLDADFAAVAELIQNAWMLLAIDVLIVSLLILGVTAYKGKIARRFQLACAMTLLLFSAVVLATTYIEFEPFKIKSEPEKKVLAKNFPEKILTLRVYSQQQPVGPTLQKQDFEKKVSTKSPSWHKNETSRVQNNTDPSKIARRTKQQVEPRRMSPRNVPPLSKTGVRAETPAPKAKFNTRSSDRKQPIRQIKPTERIDAPEFSPEEQNTQVAVRDSAAPERLQKPTTPLKRPKTEGPTPRMSRHVAQSQRQNPREQPDPSQNQVPSKRSTASSVRLAHDPLSKLPMNYAASSAKAPRSNPKPAQRKATDAFANKPLDVPSSRGVTLNHSRRGLVVAMGDPSMEAASPNPLPPAQNADPSRKKGQKFEWKPKALEPLELAEVRGRPNSESSDQPNKNLLALRKRAETGNATLLTNRSNEPLGNLQTTLANSRQPERAKADSGLPELEVVQANATRPSTEKAIGSMKPLALEPILSSAAEPTEKITQNANTATAKTAIGRREVKAILPSYQMPGKDATSGSTKSRTTHLIPLATGRKHEDFAIDRRFINRKQPSGLAPSSGPIVSSAPAFERRGHSDKKGPWATKTEKSIEAGLAFLLRYQQQDGRWILHPDFGRNENLRATPIHSDTAATGLALLAFFGASYNHLEGRYHQPIRDGVDVLIQNQRADGDLYIEQDAPSNKIARLYSHAIATMALCEAYGMTQDPRLRKPAEKALAMIVKSQHSKRGGWRYTKRYDSDTSVTGWQITALKSGELAGLKIPKRALVYAKASNWLDQAQSPGVLNTSGREFGYSYNPYAQDEDQVKRSTWRRPSQAMTAVGLLMRLYLGAEKNSTHLRQGAQYLAARLPQVEDGPVESGVVDTYYWYYATQVMFHMGGDHWTRWNDALHPLLIQSQVGQGPLSGSWNPALDRWSQGGRIYVTTLNLLSLEVTYRYLPLYRTDEK